VVWPRFSAQSAKPTWNGSVSSWSAKKVAPGPPAPCDSTGRNGPKDRGPRCGGKRSGARYHHRTRRQLSTRSSIVLNRTARRLKAAGVRSGQVVGMQYWWVNGFSPVTLGYRRDSPSLRCFLDAGACHSSGSEGSAVQRFCLPPANRCTTAMGANTVRDLATRPGRSPVCVRTAPVGLPRRLLKGNRARATTCRERSPGRSSLVAAVGSARLTVSSSEVRWERWCTAVRTRSGSRKECSGHRASQ